MVLLKIGIIGLGAMGRHHVRVSRGIEGLQLVAVADSLGDSTGIAHDLPCFQRVEELIEFGVDAAVVAVPTQFHEEVGLQLAESGIHALIEKPLAHNVEAGEKLAKAFAANGVRGAVGHIERFNPALRSLRNRLANGDLGQVYQIQTRRQGPFPSRITDVGVVKDLASHDIDLTSWLADSNYRTLSAQITHQSGRDHEDMVSITARLQNGVITSHVVNWLTPFKERVTIVSGERGAFVADTLTADLTFFENGTSQTQWDAVRAFRGVSEGTITRFALEKQEPLKSELEAFRDLILGRDSEIVTLDEGLEVLRVCQATLDSANSQMSIEMSSKRI